MAKYSSQVNTAYKLISKKGASLTLTRNTTTEDPIAGTNSTTTQSQTVAAVVLPSSSSDTSFMSFDDTYKEAMVRGRWKSFLIAAKDLTFAPREGDLIAVSGENYRLVGSKPLDPSADGAIIYTAGGIRE